ncbi:unnamed protein product [Lactuca virosa]|uniref:Glycosyl hydrolase family 32 N-terminal domain-containing protein n=1 Tax=Lactuca virosa TaxID=75947 RepID=A0AAU9M366_9ASTR|nr:unnamed protein product [Lactuca virosa]
MKDGGNESFYYHPGRIWLDTDGNPIQAHGGGILYDDRSSMYYWYGEYKDGPTYHAHKKAAARVDIIGVGCYSSKDLWKWKKEGIVLPAEQTDETHDLHISNVLERPKVIYNQNTNKYIMWMHIDDTNYTKAAVGIAVSDSPTGPFTYIKSTRPHDSDSRDMTIFKDDDNTAYLIYSSDDNSELHIGPLTEDYLDVTPVVRRVLVGQHREAPALFKHEGTYYMVTSGCTGAGLQMRRWPTLLRILWGRGRLWGTRVSGVIRWNPADLRDSRYVWLPLLVGGPVDRPLDYSFGFPLWPRVSVYWHKRWRLPYKLSGRK